jgi:hypothetical protein
MKTDKNGIMLHAQIADNMLLLQPNDISLASFWTLDNCALICQRGNKVAYYNYFNSCT